jgi:hypothetical protein
MEQQVKSGRDILNEFFEEIKDIEGIDKEISRMLVELYSQGKLTDTNIKTELDKLREHGKSKD